RRRDALLGDERQRAARQRLRHHGRDPASGRRSPAWRRGGAGARRGGPGAVRRGAARLRRARGGWADARGRGGVPRAQRLVKEGGGSVAERPETEPTSGVVVTGASSGIGRASALALAEAGRPVSLWARNAPAVKELAAEIARRFGVATDVQLLDLRDR